MEQYCNLHLSYISIHMTSINLNFIYKIIVTFSRPQLDAYNTHTHTDNLLRRVKL